MGGTFGAEGAKEALRRRLSEDERALWRAVARTVKPLRPAPSLEPPAPTTPAPSEPVPAPAPQLAAAAKPTITTGTSQHAALDRRTAQRLRRGRLPLEAKLDLHGHTQASAHAALARFLARARADGCRHVLVVTGRGAEGGGVLKRTVPRWLQEPAFQRHVTAFHEAGPRHGGGGALYVVLRRPHG